MTTEPNRLAILRKRKTLTQKALAEQAGMDIRTVQRLERDAENLTQAWPSSLEKLANVLGVEPGVLTRALPLPPDASDGKDLLDRVQFNTRISKKARNAYSLIALRYGITPTNVIELAPLFFLLHAEGSLTDRRKTAAELNQRVSDLSELTDGHMIMASPYLVNDAVLEEEKSVAARDIFGKRHLDVLARNHFDYDYERDNPFASYLRKHAEVLGNQALVQVLDASTLQTGDMPDYELCRDEARVLAGGDEETAEALIDGNILIHEMPANLRNDGDSAARQAWLKEKLDAAKRERQERLDALFGDLNIDWDTLNPPRDSTPEPER